jgi:hypothetical protein
MSNVQICDSYMITVVPHEMYLGHLLLVFNFRQRFQYS